MSEDDLEFKRLFENLQRPQDPSPDVLDAIERRMLDTFRAETNSSIAADKPVDVELTPGDATGAVTVFDRRGRRRRWAVSIAAAAAVVVLFTVVTVNRGDDRSDVEFANDPTDPTTSPTARNQLGYTEFTTVSYLVTTETDGSPQFFTDRVGESSVDATGTTHLTVRRIDATDLTDLELRVGPNGSMTVPLDFIDPPSRGGRCLGGFVRLGSAEPASQTTTALCDGIDQSVDIAVEPQPSRTLTIEEQPIEATPLTVTVTTTDLNSRRSTLWLSAAGLVRIELEGDLTLTRSLSSLTPTEDS